MNPRDLSEIRRRLNPDRRYPTVIRGCYVSWAGEVISTFAQPIHHLPAEENEKYMALFKRVLSGTAGQNLQEIDFSAAQVMEGEEHKILSTMRESGLTDEEAVSAFYERAIAYIRSISPADAQSVTEQQNASNYLILLLHDGYDIVFKDQNGETDDEQSTDVFSYILCAVCPVKQTKPQLTYVMEDANFRVQSADWAVGTPDLGFLFPAYEERSANIYRALYYSRNTADLHDSFIESVFGGDLPMPAPEQQETFQAVLQEALEEECSMDVVQTVHDQLCQSIQMHKESKIPDPLMISKEQVTTALKSCGISDSHISKFSVEFDEAFGFEAQCIRRILLITDALRSGRPMFPSRSIRSGVI